MLYAIESYFFYSLFFLSGMGGFSICVFHFFVVVMMAILSSVCYRPPPPPAAPEQKKETRPVSSLPLPIRWAQFRCMMHF